MRGNLRKICQQNPVYIMFKSVKCCALCIYILNCIMKLDPTLMICGNSSLH